MTELMTEAKLIELLLETPLFGSLDEEHVSAIISASQQLEVAPGTVLCEPRTIDQQLYVLLSGALRLESADGVGLAQIRPPRVLGEMGVLTGQPRSSRVLATEDSFLLCLARTQLEELAEADPDLEYVLLISLIKLLYHRVHETNGEIETLRNQVQVFRDRLAELAPDDPLLQQVPGDGMDEE